MATSTTTETVPKNIIQFIQDVRDRVGVVVIDHVRRLSFIENCLQREEWGIVMDEFFDYCMDGGMGCDIIGDYERCQEPEYENVPQCHDGRLEQLMAGK